MSARGTPETDNSPAVTEKKVLPLSGRAHNQRRHCNICRSKFDHSALMPAISPKLFEPSTRTPKLLSFYLLFTAQQSKVFSGITLVLFLCPCVYESAFSFLFLLFIFCDLRSLTPTTQGWLSSERTGRA